MEKWELPPPFFDSMEAYEMRLPTPLDKLEEEFTEILTDWDFEYRYAATQTEIKTIVRMLMTCVGYCLAAIHSSSKPSAQHHDKKP